MTDEDATPDRWTPSPADLARRQSAAPSGAAATWGGDAAGEGAGAAPTGSGVAEPGALVAEPGGDSGTGDGRVDAALRRLDELEQLPIAEHVAQYDALHRTLQDALAAIDEG